MDDKLTDWGKGYRQSLDKLKAKARIAILKDCLAAKRRGDHGLLTFPGLLATDLGFDVDLDSVTEAQILKALKDLGAVDDGAL